MSSTTKTDRINQIADMVVFTCAILACLYHLGTGVFGLLTAFKQRAIHVALIGTVAVLARKEGRKRNVFDWLCTAGLMTVMFYFVLFYESIMSRSGSYNSTDILIGAILIISVLYMTYRTVGWPIVIISLVALAYTKYGHLIPGALGHKRFSWTRIISHMTLGTEGIFGSPIGATATFVVLFIIMAAFLDKSGAGMFFINSALALTGSRRGGPAKAAIVASGLFGTISGSSVANVVGTGTFTIPLMKSTKFEPEVAGAVEAVASTGGQLMPPIMGAGAFVMSEVTGIKYFTIMKAAIIPALLFYTALYFSIDLYSAKRGLRGEVKDKLPSLKEEVRRSGHMIIPLVLLITMLVMGYSALRSGLVGALGVLVTCMFRKNTRMGIKKIIEAFQDAARGAATITTACACAGIIMGTMTLTGLGLKFSTLIISCSMGSTFLALVLTMVAALVLGMGLPTVASYLMLSILITPALVDLGISVLAAHMFVFYYGLLSSITPPVAVASFAAAGIAKAPMGKTSMEAVKLGITAFIVPYMFIYGPELLLQGDIPNTVLALITSFGGVYILACSMQGWFLTSKLSGWQRAVALGAAITLIVPGAVTDAVGVALMAVSFFKPFRIWRDGRAGRAAS